MEYQLFAIFFKNVHGHLAFRGLDLCVLLGWDAATWASLAQTAGDLVAAFMMKLPGLGVREDGEISRFRQSLMQPYNVSWFLIAWTLG